MSSTLDVHMVMTGHSLGRNKLEHLLASGGAPLRAAAARAGGPAACIAACWAPL
jgi:hypothetical protein